MRKEPRKMSDYGYDESGVYRVLPDGRALRVSKQFFNTILTLSQFGVEDYGWSDGW